jgi:hypothetical protein
MQDDRDDFVVLTLPAEYKSDYLLANARYLSSAFSSSWFR